MRVDRLEAEGRVTVTWLPFELHPEVPPEGAPRTPRPPNARLEAAAAEVGLVMRRRDRSINTRLALSTAEFARERGRFDAVHRALLKAHWESDAWLDGVDDLRAIAAGAGLDPDELAEALGAGRYEPLIDRYRTEAAAIGIDAVPAHVIGQRYLLLGAQPYETFIRVLDELDEERAGASAP